MSETIDFTGFPKFLSEIFQKWDSQKWFWENEKFVFGRNSVFGESLLGNLCFWVLENCNKIQEVCLCEERASKVDVRKNR